MQRYESKAEGKQSSRQKIAQVKRYEEHCARMQLPAFPVSYESMATYLVAHVGRNNGSTKSLGNVTSQLKTTAERRGLGWLSKAEASKLGVLVAEMRLEDHKETRRMSPLVTELLIRIIGSYDLDNDVELLEATLLTVGHDGLLRGGELCSSLTKDDFVWWLDGTGVSVLLHRTKTHRVGGAVKVDLGDTDSPFSGVKMLKRWWKRWGLKRKPDDAFVFPNVEGTGQQPGSGTVSTNWLRQRIKRAVQRVGLDPTRYSGHSLRAGGATDLFVARVPYFIIKRMGRWVSDAAMIYYRADDDVRRAVRRAFSKAARACGAATTAVASH